MLIKTKFYSSVFFFFAMIFLSFSQTPSGCGSINWPSPISTGGSGSLFSVPPGTGSGWTYQWIVSPANAFTIVSGQNTPNAYIKGNPGYSQGTVYVTKFKNGVSACSDFKTVLISTRDSGGGTICTATVHQIWCTPSNTHNAMINVRINASNPFPNNASILIQWDPDYFSGGLCLAPNDCLGTMGPYESNIKPSQFSIDASGTSNVSGFYVPIIVRYTDLVTGSVCTVKLNPLVTGGCGNNNSPMRALIDEETDITDSDLIPYPNPVQNKIYFKADLNISTIKIYNNLGQIVNNGEILNNEVDVEHLVSGNYFYIIELSNGNLIKGKLVKK
jgi:hypothetical protein